MDQMSEKKKWLFWGAALVIVAALWLTTLRACIYPYLNGYSTKLLVVYCGLTIAFICFAFGLGAYLIKKKTIRIERLFLICSLTVGLFYSVFLPPMTAPDEIAHYATAYKWSNCILFQDATDENGHVYMRAEDADAPITHLNTRENYKNITDSFFDRCDESEKVAFSYGLVNVGALVYIPQAIGITLGRILNLGWVLTMLFGRIMNLLCFVISVYWAIKWIPFGKMVLFVVSMLPMTLELASSMSYDIVPLSLSILFTSVCIRYIYEKENIEKKDIAVLAILLALLIIITLTVKPVKGEIVK